MAEQIVQLKQKVEILTRQTDELGATADGYEQYVHELEERLKDAGLNTPDEAPSQKDDETSLTAAGSSEVIAYFAPIQGRPRSFRRGVVAHRPALRTRTQYRYRPDLTATRQAHGRGGSDATPHAVPG
jgi:hypothetical protein